jgi:hypothetical protein
VQGVSGSRRIPRERHFFYFGVTSTDAPAQSLARRPICIRANLQTNFFFFFYLILKIIHTFRAKQTNTKFDAIDSMRVYKCAFFSIAHTHTHTQKYFFIYLYNNGNKHTRKMAAVRMKRESFCGSPRARGPVC